MTQFQLCSIKQIMCERNHIKVSDTELTSVFCCYVDIATEIGMVVTV